ncbi:hypothetical protein Tsubulata_015337 [Turnera subulata]|uniref:Uncharacterized protein n=1 Tax=Turnera subulata TaxID=218843 RepID=A0A9Q0FVY4_9ROSI|nr:hypothetical protein Tsubulata_015337 [Turnera subulata]
MASSIDPLVMGKVIGDVLDMFAPVAEFCVHYGSKQVSNGCEIKPSSAANKPNVQIIGSSRLPPDLYTLVMVDPDAPSPSDPTYREWLHWIVVDIPEKSDATKGFELVPYMGPQPPSGTHRYVFALFKQRGAFLGGRRAPDARVNFSTRQFAAQNELGIPVAALYFNSQKETD